MQVLAETPAADAEEFLLSTAKVARLTGISYRRLDYWRREGWITGASEYVGSGFLHRWTPQDVQRANLLYAASKPFTRGGGTVDLQKLADFVRRAAEAGIFP